MLSLEVSYPVRNSEKERDTNTWDKIFKKKIIETELLKDDLLKRIFPCLFAVLELMRHFQIYYLIDASHQTCEIRKFKRDDHFSEVGFPQRNQRLTE